MILHVIVALIWALLLLLAVTSTAWTVRSNLPAVVRELKG